MCSLYQGMGEEGDEILIRTLRSKYRNCGAISLCLFCLRQFYAFTFRHTRLLRYTVFPNWICYYFHLNVTLTFCPLQFDFSVQTTSFFIQKVSNITGLCNKCLTIYLSLDIIANYYSDMCIKPLLSSNPQTGTRSKQYSRLPLHYMSLHIPNGMYTCDGTYR